MKKKTGRNLWGSCIPLVLKFTRILEVICKQIVKEISKTTFQRNFQRISKDIVKSVFGGIDINTLK